MTITALRKVAELNALNSQAMSTTPVSSAIQEEIDAGNLVANPVKCGPLGLSTGEVFLTLTEQGAAKVQA